MTSAVFAQDADVSCKQAYEKARWKTQHKKVLHKTLTLWRARKENEFGKGTSRDDVQAAIDYGFKSGIYCQNNKILSQKEFQLKTIENMKAIQAAKNNNGIDLIDTVAQEAQMSCRQLVKLDRTKKEDGLSRRTVLLARDLHNIEKAYSQEDSFGEDSSKKEKRAQKLKDNFFRSVRNKAVRKHDDDSISIDDVHKIYNESIDDGTACAGRKVISRSKLKKHLVEKLADKENHADKNAQSSLEVIFKQNDKLQGVDIKGFKELATAKDLSLIHI